MPANYHPVNPEIWDRTMREISPETAKVYFLILTCRSRNSEGLFSLAVGLIAHDTGLDEEAVTAALDDLSTRGRLSYDPDAEVVLDRTALKHQPLRSEGDNRIAGAVRKFEGVPDTPLKTEFLELAAVHSPALHRAILEKLGPFMPSLPKPLRSPLEVASVFPEGASRVEEAPSRAEPERDGSLGASGLSRAGVR